MKTLACKTRTTENDAGHRFAPNRSREVPEREYAPAISSFPTDKIFRKVSCPCGGGCPACQAKSSLNISQPTDLAEIEADQIADKVMRMPIKEARPIANTLNSPGTIHRKRSVCEDEEEIIQRKPLPSGGGVPSKGPVHLQNAVSSGGRPLDRQTRSFFEPRLGYDLSSVRIHTGGTEAESAKAIDAKAYTLGSNIVFGSGEYRPESENGMRLLAHELAHVAQAGSNGANDARKIHRAARGAAGGCGICMNDPGGKEAGIIAHAEVQMAFAASNPDIVAEYAIPVVEAGTAPPFVPEVDLSYTTHTKFQKIIHIGEIKPLDDAGVQAGIARKKLQDYARELMANPELEYDEVFRMRDAPPPGPIPFFNPSNPPGCPPQMIHVRLTEPGVYQYYCEPPFSTLVKDPRCKCKKKDKDEKEKEKVRELKKPENVEKKKDDKKEKPNTGVPPYVVPAAIGIGVSAAAAAYLRKRAIEQAEKRAAQLAWRKMAEAAAARRAAAKGLAGKAVGKAAMYVEIAAAVALVSFYSDRVEAKVGLGPSPIETLYKVMTANGTPPSPEMKALLENDPVLKKFAEELGTSGDSSKLQKELARRTLEMVKNNPEMFTPEDLDFLAEYSKTAKAGQAPETAEALRLAIDAAKAGKTGGGGKGSGDLKSPTETGASPAAKQDGGSQPGATAQAPDTSATPARGVQLSEESKSKIKSASQPISRLFNEFVSKQGTGARVEDRFVRKFFEIVPPDLNESQSIALTERLVAAPEATPDAILESLRKGVEEVKRSVTPLSGDTKENVPAPGTTAQLAPPDQAPATKTQYLIIAELKAIAVKYNFSGIQANSYSIPNFTGKISGNTINSHIYGKTKNGVGVVGYITATIPAGADITRLKKGDSFDIEITSKSVLVDKKGAVHSELVLGKTLRLIK